MTTATKLWIVMVSGALSLTGATATLAQGGYGQPDYNQPDYGQQYNQPDYNQPGYGQPGGPATDQGFYNDLGPHGQWVQTPEYGNVWIPNVEPGFQPYATNGHWVVTEYGNTWVSDYAWGWAPFHYGRWYLDRYQRWAWVPGYDWGPAWVSWRSGGGYYGWAPLGPGINLNVNINILPNYWVFVPQVYITSPRLFSYCVPRPRVVNIYQNTTVINNVYRTNNRAYAYGPRREEIEYVTRRSVPVYRIENAGRPGRTVVQNNAVGIYRPDMNRGGRGDISRTPDNRRDYPRYDNAPNAGTYAENRRANPAVEQRYPQRGQSAPMNQGRMFSYGQSAPSQPGQPLQPERSQTYPPSGRQESFGQGQRDRANRLSAPQRENSQPNSGQLQAQRGDNQRDQRPAQTLQSPSFSERHGGSRGPR